MVQKNGEYGLVLVGVHTPEFGFEYELGNVRRAVEDLDVGHPIAVDNDYDIWSSSTTATGRLCASSTPTGECGTTVPAKATTSSRSGPFSDC